MPITQSSWLTNLTEEDLAVALDEKIYSLQEIVSSQNQNLNNLVEDRITEVKDELGAIATKINSLVSSDTGILIGATDDGYGTALTGTVMGKLNYLIYLLAPTPTIVNYTATGTFNNITIPTGVKTISITMCGGSGGGSGGSSFLAGGGDLTGMLWHNYTGYVPARNNRAFGVNYNQWGRRTFWSHKSVIATGNCSSSGCYGAYSWNNTQGYFNVQIAKNVVAGGGAAGTTASVVSKTSNVATSEVVTVTVGAAGAAGAAAAAGGSGGMSYVVTTNNNHTASGGAGGAKQNSFTFSNWVTIANSLYYWNNVTQGSYSVGILSSVRKINDVTPASAAATKVTVTKSSGATATANSLGRKGGSGGESASGSFSTYVGGNTTNGNWGIYFNRSNMNLAGGAGSAGSAGYVRVAW